jgi:hypothetical protein
VGIDELEAMVHRVVAEESRPLSEALLARPEATAAPPSPAEGSPVSAVRERLRQRRAGKAASVTDSGEGLQEAATPVGLLSRLSGLR